MLLGLFNKKKNVAEPQPLCFTIDTHCHILPGIDDGSPDVETSVSLVKGMIDLGITSAICTSHITEEVFPNTPETINAAADLLKEALAAQGIDFPIHLSAEYRLDSDFIKIAEKEEYLVFPNNHLLIENSFVQSFWGIENVIYQLRLKGITPILAHPERYGYYFTTKEQYDRLQELGCKFQVNLLSLAGHYDKQVKEIAHYLLDKGFIQFLGTDIHHQYHIEKIKNYLTTKEYAQVVAKLSIENSLLQF